MKTLPVVNLIRIESSEQGTFGELSMNNEPLRIYTLELPWRFNRKNISCIPIGEYYCRHTMSVRFMRPLYEVLDVEGRSGIRIHPANYAGDRAAGLKSELNGCIALGRKIIRAASQAHIIHSVDILESFTKMMEKKPFILRII